MSSIATESKSRSDDYETEKRRLLACLLTAQPSKRPDERERGRKQGKRNGAARFPTPPPPQNHAQIFVFSPAGSRRRTYEHHGAFPVSPVPFLPSSSSWRYAIKAPKLFPTVLHMNASALQKSHHLIKPRFTVHRSRK
ncbi:hypothetical protein GUJ93_ZPchr0010g10175 [Zizania palustris]|uniref:Uncharacterized protein n=1 Tax=Zizania palustris TaxID=103762 RepID=A0A8J5WDM4_ZIZPA|nr:hypothetical protein GUJ93_ZPchr0010g10175 [Zizania palustris]